MNINKEEFELIFNETALFKCEKIFIDLFKIVSYCDFEYGIEVIENNEIKFLIDLIIQKGVQERIEIPIEMKAIIEIIEENNLLTDDFARKIVQGFFLDSLFLLVILIAFQTLPISIKEAYSSMIFALRQAS